MANIGDLPLEMLEYILLKLLWKDLLSAIPVSKYWGEVLSLHNFWVKKLKAENLDHLIERTNLCCIKGSPTSIEGYQDSTGATREESELHTNLGNAVGEGNESAGDCCRGISKECHIENGRDVETNAGAMCSLKKTYFDWHSTRNRWAAGNTHKWVVRIDSVDEAVHYESDGDVLVTLIGNCFNSTTCTSELNVFHIHQEIPFVEQFTFDGMVVNMKMSEGFLFVLTAPRDDSHEEDGACLSKYLFPKYEASAEERGLVHVCSIYFNISPCFLAFSGSIVALEVKRVVFFLRLCDLSEVGKPVKIDRPNLQKASSLLTDDIYVQEFIDYRNFSSAIIEAWSVQSGEMIWSKSFNDCPITLSGLSFYWEDGYFVCSHGFVMVLMDLKCGDIVATVDEHGDIDLHSSRRSIQQSCKTMREILTSACPLTSDSVYYPDLHFTKEGFVIAQFKTQLWIGDAAEEGGTLWDIDVEEGKDAMSTFLGKRLFMNRKRIVYYSATKYQNHFTMPYCINRFSIFNVNSPRHEVSPA